MFPIEDGWWDQDQPETADERAEWESMLAAEQRQEAESENN